MTDDSDTPGSLEPGVMSRLSPRDCVRSGDGDTAHPAFVAGGAWPAFCTWQAFHTVTSPLSARRSSLVGCTRPGRWTDVLILPRRVASTRRARPLADVQGR